MADFVEVLKVGDVQDGTMKKVSVEGRDVLLAKVGDKYYAVDDKCPHLGGSLSQGTLEGTVVTCPRHSSQFDLTDGHVVRWTDWGGVKLSLSKMMKSPRPIKIHEVKVEEDRILVSKE